MPGESFFSVYIMGIVKSCEIPVEMDCRPSQKAWQFTQGSWPCMTHMATLSTNFFVICTVLKRIIHRFSWQRAFVTTVESPKVNNIFTPIECSCIGAFGASSAHCRSRILQFQWNTDKKRHLLLRTNPTDAVKIKSTVNYSDHYSEVIILTIYCDE